MTSSPLRSADLDHAAQSTLLLAQHAREAATQEKAENTALRHSGIRGAALRGIDLLDTATAPWEAEAARMEQVAGVLSRTSALHKDIERIAERLRALSEDSLFLTGLGRAVAALGSALDWHCAREVTRLCTPVAAPPLHRLGAMPELSLDAIHEATLLAEPQWRNLAQRYPEARFVEASKDTIAVVFGDLDSAESVTTFVAGVGSSDPHSWPAQLERGRSIAHATGGAAITWLGYQAPATLPQAIATDPARAGAQELQRFQRDLTARNPRQRRVVLGYSYGSVVVGQAATTGLLADAVVLMGSPGVPLDHASKFHLRGSGPGSVHALTSTGDLIDLTATGRGGVHGVDPTATRFGAKVWPTGPGDHSSYWDDPLVFQALREISAPPDTALPDVRPATADPAARSASTSPPP
ncbi:MULTISPECIES: alpha/beta hydrolase [unclassified Corynebacterium]|uniref:alpha/beta hydrolase n=1 Tax=unclassified Corynebacterium TaxID=2624378 RepID=UPI0029C9E97C|nr:MULTISPECIES: alpha/beta hydrolase [unclassified Corynebacterium]WPF65948.1 alpha/beta hydrolase [Corynebacterium sp. 22KM0430]WPF68441.1 alpha/beta hydrolase [Corynebacterium sp. 21KM1197]